MVKGPEFQHCLILPYLGLRSQNRTEKDVRAELIRNNFMLIENSCLLAPCSAEKQHRTPSSSNPGSSDVTSSPRPAFRPRLGPVKGSVPAAHAHCGAGRGGRMRTAWGRGKCARSLSPFPALSFPGFPVSLRSGSAAASGGAAERGESVSAPRHVLRSLRHVSEPGALGAPASGLQQHHPDVQRQYSADQPSQ